MINHIQPFLQVREQAQIAGSMPLSQWYPFPWYQRMRRDAPVYYDESIQGWSFFRYRDINRILHDYDTFSSQLSAETTDDDTMLTLDPPRHHQLRTLVSQTFTPRSLSLLTSRIISIVDELLDQVTQSTHADAIADISFPFPSAVIAEMLGFPQEDRWLLQEWAEQVMVEQGAAMKPISPKAGQAYAYLQDLVKQRQRQPQEDMISQLTRAEVDGKRLDFTEIVTFCSLLYFAGYETTINLMGNSFLCMHMFPAQEALLRAQPALAPGFVEEVLRYCSSIQLTVRRAKHDVVIADQQLRAGDRLILWLGSANHDEGMFPDPDRFDMQRTPNKHLAFGTSIHICLGAPLARLNASTALPRILARLQDIRLDPEAQLELVSRFVAFGVKAFPITFRASKP